VKVCGAVIGEPSIWSSSPLGSLSKVSGTVFGRRSWRIVRLRPFESVAVRKISR
jgi:hypothetical protein